MGSKIKIKVKSKASSSSNINEVFCNVFKDSLSSIFNATNFRSEHLNPEIRDDDDRWEHEHTGGVEMSSLDAILMIFNGGCSELVFSEQDKHFKQMNKMINLEEMLIKVFN